MAVKYTIPFKDDSNVLWRADIEIPNYVGDPIEVVGVGRTFCGIDYGASNEDPYTAIIGSSVTLQFYNKVGEVDILEMQLLSDLEGRVRLYKDDILEWSGFILSDGIQRYLQPNPTVISLTATDGLVMLDNVDFYVTNTPLPSSISNRSPLAFVRDVLFASSNLNNPLPIRWVSTVESSFHNNDGFAGVVDWGSLGEGWTDFNDNRKSCLYILKGMLEAFQMRIYQVKGKWVIERVNDVATGIYSWKEISASNPHTITSGTEDVNTDITFVNENQLMTIKPALTDCEVTYNHSQAENNLPNGGFDVLFSGSYPIYWGFNTGIIGSQPMLELYQPLNGRMEGNAVQLTNNGTATEEAVFRLGGSSATRLPVDSNILFKRFLLGFTIMPTEFGFPKDSNETIIWDSNPLKISVSYSLNGAMYYLNEFGYWQYIGRGLGLGVNFINMERQVQGTAPNQFYLFHAVFEGSPNVGDVLVISIRNSPQGNFIDYSYTVTLNEENQLGVALDKLLQQIPDSTGGFPIFNKQVSMESDNKGRVRFSHGIVLGYSEGSTYKSGATQEFRYIYPSVPNLKTNDIATIAFRGMGGNSEIPLPDMGDINELPESSSYGTLYIEFFIKPGQRYVLDDVYFRFEKNNDVYLSELGSTSKKTNTEKRIIDISSSFTGFMVSNIMRSFNYSNIDWKFRDSKYEGSLTGMTANAIMRTRYKPREIFQGDIYVAGQDWKFNSIYNIEGKKYLPLNSRYNVETCTVNITAIEIEDGNPVLTEKHYGSNDTILSNT